MRKNILISILFICICVTVVSCAKSKSNESGAATGGQDGENAVAGADYGNNTGAGGTAADSNAGADGTADGTDENATTQDTTTAVIPQSDILKPWVPVGYEIKRNKSKFTQWDEETLADHISEAYSNLFLGGRQVEVIKDGRSYKAIECGDFIVYEDSQDGGKQHFITEGGEFEVATEAVLDDSSHMYSYDVNGDGADDILWTWRISGTNAVMYSTTVVDYHNQREITYSYDVDKLKSLLNACDVVPWNTFFLEDEVHLCKKLNADELYHEITLYEAIPYAMGRVHFSVVYNQETGCLEAKEIIFVNIFK